MAKVTKVAPTIAPAPADARDDVLDALLAAGYVPMPLDDWPKQLRHSRWGAASVSVATPDELAQIALTLATAPNATAAELETLLRGSTPAPALPADHVFRRPPAMPEFTAVGIDQIVRSRFQDREDFDAEELAELAASIRQDGLINRPIVFVNEAGACELIAGERRWRAARLAGLTTIPVRVVEGDAKRLDIIAQIDNIQRKNLSPVEEGKGFERLITTHGLSENELSKLTGKSRGYIQQRRALATATPVVGEAFRSGALSFTIARTIVQAAPGNAAAQAAALQAINEHPSWKGKLNEEQAREYTAEAVLQTASESLAALGWQAKSVTLGKVSGTMVWTDVERPATWTGAQVAEALATQRRPRTGDPVPAATLGKAECEVLTRRGYAHTTLGPWLVVATGKKCSAYHGAELPRLLDGARAEINDVVARFQAKGFAVAEWKTGGGVVVRSDGQPGSHWAYDWADTQKLLKRVEAGGITPQGRKQQCDQCKAYADRLTYYSGMGHVCAQCGAARQAAEAAARTALRAQLEALAGSILAQLPPTLLVTLALTCGGQHPIFAWQNSLWAHGRARELEKWDLAGLTAPQLAEALLAQLTAYLADEHGTSGALVALGLVPAVAPAAGPESAVRSVLDDLNDWLDAVTAQAGQGYSEAEVRQHLALLDRVAEGNDPHEVAVLRNDLEALLGELEAAA